MAIDLNNLNVKHNREKKRYEAEVDGKLSVLDYRLGDGKITFTHTEVPPALRRQGIAGKIVGVALKEAKEQNLRVRSLCPFVTDYIDQHPEYQSLTVDNERQ